MKLLHSSDWHVGKGIRGASRADEHRAVLSEIAEIAEREAVDLVVVAGDLFDSAAPTAEAEQIVYEALLGLARSGADVALISGNHDSGRRLRAVAPLLRLGRIHVVTEPARPDDGGVLSLQSRDGVDVCLAMLPFVSKRGVVRAEALMNEPGFELQGIYADRMRRLIDMVCEPFGAGTVNVLVTHAFVNGGQDTGSERAAHLLEYAIPAAVFPPTAGYVALGHLHRPQRIDAGAPLHYCGSPLQLDFGEVEQAKRVNLVELEPGVPATVTGVPLTRGRPLHMIRGRVDELAAIAPDDDGWLKVVVREDGRAGLAAEVRDLLGDRVVEVRVESPTTPPTPTAGDHRNRSPQELFDEFLRGRQITDDRVRALFAELLEDEHEGARR